MADSTKYRFGSYSCGSEKLVVDENTSKAKIDKFVKACQDADSKLKKEGKKEVHIGCILHLTFGKGVKKAKSE